jgi:hypothetical protein
MTSLLETLTKIRKSEKKKKNIIQIQKIKIKNMEIQTKARKFNQNCIVHFLFGLPVFSYLNFLNWIISKNVDLFFVR